MRCQACNKSLNDQESTRKSASTREYLDLCNGCFKTIQEVVKVVENPYFSSDDDIVEREEANARFQDSSDANSEPD